MVTTKYFRVVATDNLPNFEALSQWAGVWFGVAAVDDEETQNKLIAAGKAELTLEEYESELKKKQGMQGRFHDWREVAGSAVGPIAKPVALADASKPVEQPTVDQTAQIITSPDQIQATQLPKPRQKSAQKP